MRRLILSLALIAATAQSEQPPKNPRIEAKQQTIKVLPAEEKSKSQAAVSQSGPPGPVPETRASEFEKHADDDREGETEFWSPLFGYRLKITDTLLVAFTALLFIATLRLYFATRALVTGAEQTARKQLRAYLSMVGGSITLQNNATFIRIYIQVKNSEQTPAYKVSTWVTHQIRDLPQLVPTFAEAPPPEQRAGRSIDGPQMPFDLVIDHPITAEQREGINNGSKRIFVWGQIDYIDVFDEPRWTKFRCVSGVVNGQVGWTLEPDHDGNEAT